MGVAVSDWRLASAVARLGQFGVVSGTALDVVLVRRLQAGDIGGHIRRAASHFPVPGVMKSVFDRYFVEGGRQLRERFKSMPMGRLKPSRNLLDLQVLSNFVEVFLAKEGHDGLVGINLLTKVQAPTIPSLYGAMLAGVDAVLMGAGIPKEIPGVLDKLAGGEAAELRLDVKGADRDNPFWLRFDPAEYCRGDALKPKRPKFFPIISSAVLATMLSKKASGRIDGFIVEGPTAGGHNAPPRGKLQLSGEGEPVYGERDVADLEAISAVGLPFWVAGSYAEPQRVVEALDAGATGVQVGTAFAYTEESGFSEEIKAAVLKKSRAGEVEVFTDPLASPTGFPFKVVPIEHTVADQATYEKRDRVCDLGYLRTPYAIDGDTVGWRCASEPVQDFERKGGDVEETVGRKCVCNALMSSIELGQIQKSGGQELPLVTSGDDVAHIARFLRPGAETYTAADVIDYLLRDVVAQ
ncbi:MAG: nitronate monooxygenase [bacterium]|nr:nitronate monooxygenase [bacterium]MCP4964846.1 nitronate monooxygenase [bacterium]